MKPYTPVKENIMLYELMAFASFSNFINHYLIIIIPVIAFVLFPLISIPLMYVLEDKQR